MTQSANAGIEVQVLAHVEEIETAAKGERDGIILHIGCIMGAIEVLMTKHKLNQDRVINSYEDYIAPLVDQMQALI